MDRSNIGISGSRNFKDWRFVFDSLQNFCYNILGWGEMIRFVLGDAKGADEYAWMWCYMNDMPYTRKVADWETFGRAAGPSRNFMMLEEGLSYVIAFPDMDSRGTKHFCLEADKRGIPIWIPESNTSILPEWAIKLKEKNVDL